MKQNERLLWAFGIVFADFLIFAVPLTALIAAYVIIAKPAGIKQWIDKVYAD